MKTNCTIISRYLFSLLILVSGQVAGLQAQTIISNDNVALNKAVTASSIQMDSYPYKAFDGNLNTRFSSLYSDDEWISVDLGQLYLIGQVTLVWERAYAKDFNLLFSRNGSFTDSDKDSIQVRNNLLGTDSVAGTNVIKTKSNTLARYVRMQGIRRATIYGYSLFEFRVAGSTSVSNVLPATLSGLTASASNNATLIEWFTTTEYNTAGFSVERSSDGTNFSAIGWVNGTNNGTVNSHYSYTDKQQFTGKNFYRLKVFDLGGKSASTAAVSINTVSNTILKTYPVPVTDHIVVEYKGTAGEHIDVSLVNACGQPVYTTGVNIKGTQQTMVINRTGNMKSGMYVLCIKSTANASYSYPVVLQ